MIDLLILLLRPALQALEGGSRNPLHWLALLVAWPLDIVICRTTWVLVAGWPKRGDWMVSQTLTRLCHPLNAHHPNYLLFVAIARKINRESPTGRHIPTVGT